MAIYDLKIVNNSKNEHLKIIICLTVSLLLVYLQDKVIEKITRV